MMLSHLVPNLFGPVSMRLGTSMLGLAVIWVSTLGVIQGFERFEQLLLLLEP